MSTTSSATDVEVVLRGVHDRRDLNALTAAIALVPGVGAVTTLGYETPDAPVVSVRVTGTVALAGELRGRLGPGVARVAEVDGRLEVDLRDGATVTGRPRAAADTPIRRTVRPARGPSPSRTARPSPRDPTVLREPFRPWTLQAEGVRRTPAPDAVAPVPPAAVPPADPAGMLDAFGGEADLSILIYDDQLSVRAAYGGLHTRSQRLRDGVVGRHIDDVLPPDVYVGLAELAAGALHGRSGEVEVAGGTADRHYRITVKPVHDGSRIAGCMTVTRDVTQQHRDAGLLHELHDVFEATFDRSPAGQGLLTPEGEWLRVNDALGRLLGRPGDALIGTSVLRITSVEDRERERALIDEVRAGSADGYELDKRFDLPDGGTVHVFVRMSPVRAADGAVRGFVAHVVDADRWRPAAAG